MLYRADRAERDLALSLRFNILPDVQDAVY
jgi:hypothetical protein